MGNLDEDASAITGIGFAANRTTVVKIDQNFQGVRHQLMGFLSLHVDDESEAARVVLELRIIQPLFQRRTERRLPIIISGRHCILVNAAENDCVRIFVTQI